MWSEREGPKMDYEVLNVRGEEKKFIDSVWLWDSSHEDEIVDENCFFRSWFDWFKWMSNFIKIILCLYVEWISLDTWESLVSECEFNHFDDAKLYKHIGSVRCCFHKSKYKNELYCWNHFWVFIYYNIITPNREVWNYSMNISKVHTFQRCVTVFIELNSISTPVYMAYIQVGLHWNIRLHSNSAFVVLYFYLPKIWPSSLYIVKLRFSLLWKAEKKPSYLNNARIHLWITLHT